MREDLGCRMTVKLLMDGSIVALLLGLVVGQALFGGGCLVENERLIMSGSFEVGGTLAKVSYSLDLAEDQFLPPDGRLRWIAKTPGNKLPGDLKIQLNHLFYIVGGYFSDVKPKIVRRDADNNPLDNTSLAKDKNGEVPIFYSPPGPPSSSPPSSSPTGSPSSSPTGPPSNHSSSPPGTPRRLPDFNPKSVTQKYLDALNDDLHVGVFYNNNTYLVDSTEQNSTLVILNPENNARIETTGPVPEYRKGFSIAQARNMMYLASPGRIHSLDLNSFVWSEYKVKDLVASKSGCLYLYRNILIHSFGLIDGKYSETTQFVDTSKWKLTSTFSSNPSLTATKLSIILSALGASALLLTLVSTLIYLAKKTYSKKKEISPPQYLTESIWATPKPKYSMDLSLNSDPSQYYDFTLDHKPFTTSSQ